MNLQEFLFINEAKVIPGLSVKFKKIETPKGTVMGLSTKDDKTYIIAASLENFKRFEKWDNKEATADILPLNKKIKIEGKSTPLAKIRVDVSLSREEGDGQQKPEEDDGVF